MEDHSSRLESLLKFLAQWEAARRTAFGTLFTAGEIADIRELERIYGLSPSAGRQSLSRHSPMTTMPREP
jgi:hypothetical protein